MKEAGVRSALERERTKMRERQRRSITTNIFHGLRKHGGYRLSPRADINEVLRHLAREAGWIVQPDGTTYRSTTPISNGTNACPLCGGGGNSAAATPSCSVLGGGLECSTTTSPRRGLVGGSALNSLPSGGRVAADDALLAIYMNGATAHNGGASNPTAYGKGRQQQQLYLLHEPGVSNKNAAGSS